MFTLPSNPSRPYAYPPTPRRPVEEVLHGVSITDPFQWLEDGTDPEVQAWVEAQNLLTDDVLGSIPHSAAFAADLRQAVGGTTLGVPVVKGRQVFYTRRGSDQSQAVLCIREGDQPVRVILDPNEADGQGLTALDWWVPSPDGRYVAFGYSRGGDEWSTLHVLDVDAGEVLSERIPRTRYASIAWEPDGSGFYYTRYPAPGEVPAGEENYHRHLYHHRLGRHYAQDPKVFGEGRPMREVLHVDLSADGRYLLINAGDGWRRSELFLCDRQAAEPRFTSITGICDALFYGRMKGSTLFLLTNLEAPRYRLLTVDVTNPHPDKWREAVPQQPELTLDHFTLAGDQVVLTALKDAVSKLLVFDLVRGGMREIPLPTLGTVSQVAGGGEGEPLLVRFESFALPPAIFAADLESGRLSPWAAGESKVEAGSIAIRQVFYGSRDGTRVPMFILHRRDVVPDGDLPTVLTGYGGFNLSRTPEFMPQIYPWLARGGVWALASLRGGGEYGEDWHRAGMLGNKQNVFDDFITAGEYLIREGYTRTERLGIFGRSNGGLLVGAALTQRPELFRAVVCGVPLLDMLRYHKFLIGALWIPEYGSADEPEQFDWLYAYSPYHRVDEGEAYPAVYFFTANGDSRVDPLHARKMAALLQEGSASGEPVLLRVEFEAGHGVGKPVEKIVQEQAEVWGFFAWKLGMIG